MTLFDRLHAEGNTLVVVTHEAHVAKHARRAIHLSDGNIVKDEQQGAKS
jgi:ABC-type lipoprotein export system ATPase subunit